MYKIGQHLQFLSDSLMEAGILRCDFDIACNDFIFDVYWAVTDDAHPQSVDLDHRLNTTSGHYLFHNPSSKLIVQLAEIKKLMIG
ncbi:hypothetical protein I4U23_004165 [Adineta vaga]|nr:hypothetical protein I4U23_004165 [Adineta vaga]